jgi:hypothetical protein
MKLIRIKSAAKAFSKVAANRGEVVLYSNRPRKVIDLIGRRVGI